MDTSKLPEARLMLSDGRPLFLVFKTDKGWVGAPGLKRNQYLTDEDVADAIPYVPAPQPQVPRIGVDIRFKRVMERTQGERPMWLSVGSNVTLDDDEVVDLTEHESVTVREDNLQEVGDFLDAEECTPFRELDRLIEAEFLVPNSVGLAPIDVQPGTRIWRTQNVFYVLHPNLQYFRLHARRVRNP